MKKYSKKKFSSNLKFSKDINTIFAHITYLKKYKYKIAIYGNGIIGNIIAKELKEQLVIIADKTPNSISKYCNVCRPEELNNYDFDKLVICVLGREDEIINSLDVPKNKIFVFDLLNSKFFEIEYANKIVKKSDFHPISNKKLLIYTDSRGGEIIDSSLNTRIPIYSYISMLLKKFKINYIIRPKTYTTIIDFLNYVKNKDLSKYDYIILHVGIIDFSTRPLSHFNKVYNLKNKIAKKLFPQIEMKIQYYEDIYEGEETFSLYDTDFLNSVILPKISEISKTTKIIWLGMNKVDLTWDGNYIWKRPLNINNMLVYQQEILKFLKDNLNNIDYIDIDKIKASLQYFDR